MNKTLAKSLQGDFVPDGTSEFIIERGKTDWKELSEDQVHRCCTQTSYDVQSGPIYCGNIADYFTIVGNDEIVTVCKKHAK